jgi:hypothetical protein
MARSQTSIRRDDSGVVWVHLGGHVRASDVDEAVKLVSSTTEPATAYVIDCEDVTNYAADVRAPGSRLLEALKERGAERGVCITASSLVRMMASAVAFVMGMPVRFAPSREEANIVLAREVLWRRVRDVDDFDGPRR